MTGGNTQQLESVDAVITPCSLVCAQPVAPPAAVLDSVVTEEKRCRCRLEAVANDFIDMFFRGVVFQYSSLLRCMAIEEVQRHEMLQFHRTWSLRVEELLRINMVSLGPLMNRNLFKTRAKYFSKWLRIATLRNRTTAQSHRFKCTVRCAVFGELRLVPYRPQSHLPKLAGFPDTSLYRSLSVLSQPLDVASEVQKLCSDEDEAHLRRAMVRESRAALRVVLRMWIAPHMFKRLAASLEAQEIVKRKQMVALETKAFQRLFSACNPVQ